MAKLKSLFLRTTLAAVTLFIAYLLLLIFPQPLFSCGLRRSPHPPFRSALFQKWRGKRPAGCGGKLGQVPAHSDRHDHHIFICNERWRQILFFNKNYGVGGVSFYPLTSNVFLRDAKIENNQLISPLGTPILGTRTLDYFITHEITHDLTGRALGPIRYFQLPQYIREGYADYVGKGNSFNYAEARQAFLINSPEMDYQKSGLYLRFNLLVAYLLDHRGLRVTQLLQDPPPQQVVEATLKN